MKIIREISVNTPVVWNSNMYHSPEIAEILEGVVDVYLGDFKYGNDVCAQKYSKIKNYLEIVQSNFEFAYKTAEILLRPWFSLATLNAVQNLLPNGSQKISHKSGSTLCSSTGRATGQWNIQNWGGN